VLGYRSLFTTTRHDELLPLTQAALYSWMRTTKGWDVTAMQAGRWASVGEHARALLLRLDDRGGATSVRVRIHDNTPVGRWTVQTTVHVPAQQDQRAWAWVDVEAPDEQNTTGRPAPAWAGAPKFVEPLLNTVQAWDGQARLGIAPRVVRGDASAVHQAILDPGRRGMLFVAGSSDLPMTPWSALIGKLVRQTLGLAGSYVLDDDATDHLHALLGPAYASPAGVLRSYRPNVRPDTRADATRHRMLGTDRLVASADHPRLARVLGIAARAQTAEHALPAAVAAVHQRLEQHADALLVRRMAAQPAPAPARLVSVAAPAVTFPTPATVPALPQQPAGLGRADQDQALIAHLRTALGVPDLSPATIGSLTRLLDLGRSVEQAQEDITSRLQDLQEDLDRVQRVNQDLIERLEDEQVESRLAVDAAREAEQSVLRLRAALIGAGQHEQAWTAPDTDDLARPADFAELLAWLPRLTWITFTGNPDHATDLDLRDPLGTWSGKAWDALLALNDYAAAKADGRWDRDIAGYLANTPDGCHSWSANRYATDESADVRNNQVFARARMFPVPTTVHPDGRAWCGAHVKVAQSGMISPRMHLLDATAADGRIYVGYIGRHLPTRRTN